MHIVIFGLTVSSSWGNGHATLWRSLICAMVRRGHTITFFERDVPYYASTRDLWELPSPARLRLYCDLCDIKQEALRELQDADLAICTSFCPDGVMAAEWILDSNAAIRAFYDLDTPVTLSGLASEKTLAYLPGNGLRDFDLVLSYTGGRALHELKSVLGARRVAPLYGWVDPERHFPVEPVERFHSTLSYLGTYAADRQPALRELFLKPAAAMPDCRFLIGGAQYPEDFPWASNTFFAQHLEPAQHPSFFCSSRVTLNITRRAMADYGYCPSGRLFEAAACGTAIFTDEWEGLNSFFAPGKELLCVESAADVLEGLSLGSKELQSMAMAARERTLQQHTADHRLRELETLCNELQSDRSACGVATL
jgi:spore maturation protein CgeB